MYCGEEELKRFQETIVVLYRIISSSENPEKTLESLQDAIHDAIFGHSIRDKYYLTEEEYIETENEILELLEINREDEW